MRFYAHGRRYRLGAFLFAAMELASGSFDEQINGHKRLRGFNGSFTLKRDAQGKIIFLDPFFIDTNDLSNRIGSLAGDDKRSTFGARLWGRWSQLRFDWTIAKQTGIFSGREVDAWALFGQQSLSLSEQGWRPRLTAQVDIASGGAGASGKVNGFNQLYSSPNYLGQGRFLSLSNLLLITPGLELSPSRGSSLSVRYGFARRLKEGDAAYAGSMKPYPGTSNLKGGDIGRLLRVAGSHTLSRSIVLSAGIERMAAGDLLRRAGVPSGSYSYFEFTLRY